MRENLKLDIIHYFKVEYYPPIINLIQFLESEKNINYQVYTTTNSHSTLKAIPNFKIKRIIDSNPSAPLPIRILKQLYFNFSSIFYLLIRNPDVILYYETISCAAPIVYKKYFNRKVKLMAHYHELTTKEQVKKETRLVRLLNPLEKRMYAKFHWISHTNKDRIRIFHGDYKKFLKRESIHEMPNFPPLRWTANSRNFKTENRNSDLKFPIRTILAGSISCSTMYLKEYCEWILKQNGRFTFDIYTFNVDLKTQQYIKNINNKLIQIHKAIPYEKLPELFSNFDIGIILYKAAEENMRYNVPNKLFEYHTCGLDVWFPVEQKTAFTFTTIKSYPKIIAVDYKNLEKFNYHDIISRKEKTFYQHNFQCENVYRPLIYAMQS